MKDDYIYGNYTIYKTGMVATSFNPDDEEKIIWEEKGLEGAVFGVYAKKDIEFNGAIYYKENELIEKITTNEEGYAATSNLLVGSYYLKEITAPYGYIISDKKISFEIKNNLANTGEIIKLEGNLMDDKCSLALSISKRMEESKIKDVKDAYKSVVFGLYAKEDILDYNGEILIPADTLIDTSHIDSKGDLIDLYTN